MILGHGDLLEVLATRLVGQCVHDRICDHLFSIVGAELLAQATWGHGSSRVFLHPGHLEPLG